MTDDTGKTKEEQAWQVHGLDLQGCKDWAKAQGLPAFRGQQLFDGLYRQAPERFADLQVLPGDLRAELDSKHSLLPAQEVQRQSSEDGTVKSLLQLHDGLVIESVSIPTSDRHTICVSSQVGCPVGCTFCASGLDGVARNLTVAEMVYQVLFHHQRRPVTNVVFMGSGEPMFNYANVLQAIAIMGESRGLGLGRRRFTVSTSGVPDRIRQLAEDEPQVTLALSLHAPDDDTRSKLVPLNRRWPVTDLMAAMDDYASKVNRRITLEYVLLADANMLPAQAQQLGDLAQRYQAHINLIPFNPVIETGHQRPEREAIVTFARQVTEAGGQVTVRGQRGADIDAACGQLARKRKKKNS